MGKRLVLSAVCLWGSLMSVFSQDAKVFDADSFNVAVTYDAGILSGTYAFIRLRSGIA